MVKEHGQQRLLLFHPIAARPTLKATTETGSFGVWKQRKQTKDQPKQQEIC
jgi:hypothetical protein